MLVITTGSAEAERGFSIMNHIKFDRRSKLTPRHVEDLLRIRINGPDNMDSFSAIKYAKRWVNQNHLRTDDPKSKVELDSKLQSANDNNDINGIRLITRSNLF